MRLFLLYATIAVTSAGCCFSKKHTDNRITKSNSIWLPDSCYTKYRMASNMFDTFDFSLVSPVKGYLLTLETDKCSETLTESQKIDFSSQMPLALSAEHESSNQTEGINLWVGKVKLRYDLDQKFWAESVSNEGRVFQYTGDLLDSLEVLGKVYKPVLHAKVVNTSVLENAEANEIWYTPHFGFIQIETQNGTIYQRVRN